MPADQPTVPEVVALAKQKFENFDLFMIEVSGAAELNDYDFCLDAFDFDDFDGLVAAADKEEGGLESLNDWLNEQPDAE